MPNKDEHMFTLVGNQVSAIDKSNTISITHPAIWRNYKVWTNIGRMWSNWNSLIMPICNCKNYIVKRMGGICLVKQKTWHVTQQSHAWVYISQEWKLIHKHAQGLW